MKRILLYFVFLCSAFAAAKDISAEQFLTFLRDSSSHRGSTYGVLEGNATHIRREKGKKIIEEYPCFMALIITPGKSITQIIFDNQEGYLVGRSAQSGTSLRPLSSKRGIMERIGVSPRDLSMSFIDGKFVRELEPENVKMADCRVLLLKDEAQNEWVRIYAAKDYYFVLKAEFFNVEPQKNTKPSRTLEINSFAKKNGLYYPQSLELFGIGWRTDIVFDKTDMNIYSPEQGTKIFRSIK